MSDAFDNWKTQIKKGYLDLCILLMIRKHTRVYGFDLLEKLAQQDIVLKEGTLYPLLSRMTNEGLLKAAWETENLKGHPRKFYSLAKSGEQLLDEMNEEYERMIRIYKSLN